MQNCSKHVVILGKSFTKKTNYLSTNDISAQKIKYYYSSKVYTSYNYKKYIKQLDATSTPVA